MGRKSTGFQAKVLLIRSVKHILQAAEDFKEFADLVVEHHPEWKDDMLLVGAGLATLYDSMCGIYEAFWGPVPEEWETHH
jgi:hypothetical protein